MTATSVHPEQYGQALVARLDSTLPSTMAAGATAAVFCLGSCFHRGQAIVGVELMVGEEREPARAVGMPRARIAQDTGDPRAYRSGFWGSVVIRAPAQPGALPIRAAVTLAGGARVELEIGEIDVIQAPAARATAPTPGGMASDGLIAVCMATFDPDPKLLRRQIESLRAQTDTRWLCVISDDHSSAARLAEIEALIAGDARFVLSRAPARLGFYRNFERALGMVPAEAELVALCDQDDYWRPEKLSRLRAALGRAHLAYSDQRLTDAGGRVLRETLWRGRRNNYRNLASQLVANTISGAAMLFRRELLEYALPFPEGPGFLFHDHWLGLVAMATGELAFVPEPLYDYVQHPQAVFGDVAVGRAGARAPRRWIPLGRGVLDRWRAAYFYGYLSRVMLAQTVLARCAPQLRPRHRRMLERFVAAERSPWALAWLALRPLRLLLGLSETLGSEADLTRGILWRRAIGPWSHLGERRGRRVYEADLPDPASFEQPRLRRWRARL